MRGSIPQHGICPVGPQEKACATSKPACALRLKSDTTWAFAPRYFATLWPGPTSDVTGASMGILLRRLSQSLERLYADDSFEVDLQNTVYALDSTTIDLCLSVFPWAHFRRAKAAIKMHTLLDLRGNIPTFIDISPGKMHDVNMLDILNARTWCLLYHGPRLS